jgi:hypothetical protein
MAFKSTEWDHEVERRDVLFHLLGGFSAHLFSRKSASVNGRGGPDICGIHTTPLRLQTLLAAGQQPSQRYIPDVTVPTIFVRHLSINVCETQSSVLRGNLSGGGQVNPRLNCRSGPR